MIKALRRRYGRWPGSTAARGWAAALSAVGLALISLAYGVRVGRLATVDEDAYISLRYARNLLRGDGLVFNAGGERVEGITNLLWTLTLAAGSWITDLTLPATALASSIACGALSLLAAYLWCLWLMARCGLAVTAAMPLALAAPLLLVWQPGFVFYSASGLETPLAALLLLCGLWLVCWSGIRPRYSLATGGLCLGAAFLIRPEAGLALAAACAAAVAGCFLEEKRAPLGEAAKRLAAAGLPGGAVVIAATLWRLSYYGAPVPNTAFAKSGAPEAMAQWGVPYLQAAAADTVLVAAWALSLAAATVDRRFLRHSLAGLLVIPAWAAYVVYVGGDYMPSHRLFVPLLPVVTALAAASPAPILASLRRPGSARSLRHTARPFGALACVLALVPLAAVAALASLQAAEALSSERAEAENNARWNAYRRAAAGWFDENDPGALVAANSVGALSYHSEAPIVDMLGLNNEQIGRYGEVNPDEPPGHQAANGDYVLSREPEYIIPFGLKPGYRVGSTSPYFLSDRQLARSETFRSDYEPVEVTVDAGEYGPKKLTMFHRKEEPLPEAGTKGQAGVRVIDEEL